MIDFYDVMERVKQILSTQSKKTKILDRDIADSLMLGPQYFAVIKRRKKIPYESLALFCKRHNISMNWILLAQKPQYLT
ncbi:helix-turn-helix domain-containing protein [Sulfurovum sp.]|uniref:helix-turn-helix domain-containing protein n=1 Tax=Sulfurovum sp. TaxID=1969726 RepID=UPI002867D6A4|nr:helix-turn-helix domain-containing protein [Sulfurovum sp.]